MIPRSFGKSYATPPGNTRNHHDPLLAAVLLAATAQPAPKNVILLIADGTGPAHSPSPKQMRGAEFRIGTMPVIGLQTTQCADRNVTDSAAGRDRARERIQDELRDARPGSRRAMPLLTVLDHAEKRGKATGLVTTAAFWDATPAAFAAHAKHRHDAGIAEQMLRSDIEVIAGTRSPGFRERQAPDVRRVREGLGLHGDHHARATRRARRARACSRSFRGQDRDIDHPTRRCRCWRMGASTISTTIRTASS